MLARIAFAALFAVLQTIAQQQPPPVIGPFGVLHGASLQPVRFHPAFESPEGIAPGSIFILKGAYLGPEEIAVGTAPFGLRLPDAPGGAEVHVRSLETGEVVQARIVHAWAFQVAALLPETFPLGGAEAQVWYRGQASAPALFRAVRSYPALFTLSQDGSGRGIIQNYEGPANLPLNGLTRPARPGQTVILWGTGLGSVQPGEVRAILDGRSYPLAYAGPAPGLPGVDQYNLRLPDDPESFGCYRRLAIGSEPLSGGQVSIAITPDGGPCEHPWGLTPERMAELDGGARMTWIRFYLSDGLAETDTPQPFFASSGSAAFAFSQSLNAHGVENATRQTARFGNIIPPARRTCGLFTSVGAVLGDFIPGPIEPLPEPPPPANPAVRAADGGQPWRLIGPGGRTVEVAPQPGGDFLGPVSFDAGFFAPGEWTVAVPGGEDLAAFETPVRMPSLPEVDVPASAQRGEPLPLTWLTEGVEAGVEANVRLIAWLPTSQPERRRQVGLDCPVNLSHGQVTLPLALLGDQLDDADSVELTFRVVSQRMPAIPGVERVELEGAAFRTWTVPLE